MSEAYLSTTPIALLHNKLPPLKGKPTHPWLLQAKKILQQNAMAIPYPNASHGCLRLTVNEEDYKSITKATTDFDIPTWPTDTLSSNATAAAVQKHEMKRKEAIQNKLHYDNADKALIKSIHDAVPEQYLLEMKSDGVGYHGKTTIDHIEHLEKTYGKVTPEQLMAIENTMLKPWTPDKPLELLWDQLNTGYLALKGTQGEITTKNVIVKASHLIQAHGIKDLNKAIKAFNNLDDAEQTLAKFKEILTEAYHDLPEEDKQTSANTGYHANAATENKENNSDAKKTVDDPENWCWTHGLWNHSSKDCQNPHPNHVKDSTITNMCGGCDRIRRRRGERPIWQPRCPLNCRDNNNNNEAANEATAPNQG